MKPIRTRDSQLSFFINQLDNFDPKLHEPLVNITWSRDVTLRPGISLANESTSFMRSTFAAPASLNANLGTNNGGNMPWISAETTAIPGIDVNGERIVTPLRLLAREISYTSPELERSQLLGQSIDTAKLEAFNRSYQMNIDQMVYIGSTDVKATGLLNSSQVTAMNAPTGNWATATPAQILADINALLGAQWAASGYSIVAPKIGLPPAKFAALAATIVSTAGSMSILKFVQENSIALQKNGAALEIVPIKWLTGRGAGGTDRMIAYSQELDYVRFPMVPVRRETPYYYGIRYTQPYLWAFGELEIVYP